MLGCNHCRSGCYQLRQLNRKVRSHDSFDGFDSAFRSALWEPSLAAPVGGLQVAILLCRRLGRARFSKSKFQMNS